MSVRIRPNVLTMTVRGFTMIQIHRLQFYRWLYQTGRMGDYGDHNT